MLRLREALGEQDGDRADGGEPGGEPEQDQQATYKHARYKGGHGVNSGHGNADSAGLSGFVGFARLSHSCARVVVDPAGDDQEGRKAEAVAKRGREERRHVVEGEDCF